MTKMIHVKVQLGHSLKCLLQRIKVKETCAWQCVYQTCGVYKVLFKSVKTLKNLCDLSEVTLLNGLNWTKFKKTTLFSIGQPYRV